MVETDSKRLLRMANEDSHELTLEYIEQAMIQLLQKKPFEAITVTDIATRAGVSRTAFYKNYQTKEAVVKSILDRVFSELQENMSLYLAAHPADMQGMLCELFRGIKKNDCIILVQSSAGASIELLKYTNRMAETYLPNPDNNPYLPYYVAGAFHNVIYHWIKGGMKESPEEMARLISKI